MVIINKKDLKDTHRANTNIVIDLDGPDGNAYVLMAYARDFAKQMHMTQQEIEKMMKDMRSDDYEHLLQVFDKNFGSVMLIRSDDPEDSDSDDELLPDNIPDKMVDNAITAAALYNNKIGYFPNLNNC